MSSSSDLRRPFLIMGGIVVAVLVAVAVVVVVTLTGGEDSSASSASPSNTASAAPSSTSSSAAEPYGNYSVVAEIDDMRQAYQAVDACTPSPNDGCGAELDQVDHVASRVVLAAMNGQGETRSSLFDEARRFHSHFTSFQDQNCGAGFDADLPSGTSCASLSKNMRSSLNQLGTQMHLICTAETSRTEEECSVLGS